MDKQGNAMFTVIRVYSRTEDDFVAVVSGSYIKRTYFHVSEFVVADIMQTAGADVVIGSSLSKTQFKRTYRRLV
jgi:hypothetical protein